MVVLEMEMNHLMDNLNLINLMELGELDMEEFLIEMDVEDYQVFYKMDADGDGINLVELIIQWLDSIKFNAHLNYIKNLDASND
jgi:hypothetical protein